MNIFVTAKQTVGCNVAAVETMCYFCKNYRPPRIKCQTRDAVFRKCKRWIFQLCLQATPQGTYNLQCDISALSRSHRIHRTALVGVTVRNISLKALIDKRSTESYIAESVVLHHSLKITKILQCHICWFCEPKWSHKISLSC